MKALLITYCFPPNNFPEAILSSKTLGNLKGFNIDVVTIGDSVPFMSSIDNYSDEYAKKKFKNIRYIKIPFKFKIYSYSGLSYFFNNPDFFKVLNDTMYNETKKIIDKYDVLITWSQYHSIHLVGLKIKNAFPNIKWLGHFSDPWIDNYLTKKKFNNKIFLSNLEMEKNVIENLDCISFTNEETKRLILTKYADNIKNKSIILPHIFDLDLIKNLKVDKKKKITIRYFGRFYSQRKPDPLFKAVENLLKNNKIKKDDFLIELVGINFLKNFKIYQTLAKYNLVNKIIKLRGWVNYKKSLELMLSSDGFLVIDAPAIESVFFPSKLVEYISFKIPIFGITPPGTAFNIIEKFGGWIADPQDEIEIQEKFLEFLNYIKKNRNKSFGNQKIFENYNSNNVSLEFSSKIKKILSSNFNSEKIVTNYNIDFETVKNFGVEWKTYDQNYLFKKNEFSILFNNYFDIFPWDLVDNKSIGFDLGCGSGRWAKLFCEKVNKLICIDPSTEAILTAKNNLQGLNCDFINSTIENANIEDNSIDFAYSIGVLHHVPDTGKTIKTISNKLKKGAPFLLYLYYNFENRPLWYKFVWKISDIVRMIISRLPRSLTIILSFIIASLIYFPLSKASLFFEKYIYTFKNMPLHFYRNTSFYTMRTDALDRFGTQLEKRYSKDEIYKMLSNSGFTNIKFSNNTPYWTCVGIKK